MTIFKPCPLLMVAVALLLNSTRAAELQTVQVAPDHQGFILAPTGAKFIPWGHNYASVDILARLAKEPARVEREFAEMKAAGTTVARIHPEFLHLMAGPDKTKPEGVQLLLKLLKIAEANGIYLKITGLANYTIKDRAEWYDKLEEAERWRAQAFFWEAVANACKDSPAVFAYDLVNEPVPTGKPDEGWYMGKMGDVEFCQRFTLTPGKRSGEDVMREWTRTMIAAIRKHDDRHLITMGMFPFPGVYKPIAEQLDFVSPHLYPKTGKVEEELKLLKQFDWGKPIVIGETFPLSCPVEDEREFLLKSRGTAHGWIGHWPDESPVELAELKKNGKATMQNAIWLGWVELFKEVGPEMLGKTEAAPTE